jgi:hypothetical protein
MKKNYLTKKQEKALIKKFGNHARVAEHLGITYRMWLFLRRHEKEVSPRIQMIIDYRMGQ